MLSEYFLSLGTVEERTQILENIEHVLEEERIFDEELTNHEIDIQQMTLSLNLFLKQNNKTEYIFKEEEKYTLREEINDFKDKNKNDIEVKTVLKNESLGEVLLNEEINNSSNLLQNNLKKKNDTFREETNDFKNQNKNEKKLSKLVLGGLSGFAISFLLRGVYKKMTPYSTKNISKSLIRLLYLTSILGGGLVANLYHKKMATKKERKLETVFA